MHHEKVASLEILRRQYHTRIKDAVHSGFLNINDNVGSFPSKKKWQQALDLYHANYGLYQS